MLAAALAVAMFAAGLALDAAAARGVRVWALAAAQVVGGAVGAWLLGWALGWPEVVVAGLVLTAAAPGAGIAGLLAALSGGAVAGARGLAVASTVLAVVALPALTAGMAIPVTGAMWLLVGLPFAAGMLARRTALARFDGAASTLGTLATLALMAVALRDGGHVWPDALPAALILAVALAALGRALDRGDAIDLVLPLRAVAVPLALALGAGRPDWAATAALYGVAMTLTAAVVLALRLRRLRRT